MAALRGPRMWAYRLYRGSPAPVRGLGERTQRLLAERAARALPLPEGAAVRLLIGPLNTAGQGSAWARAVREHGSDVAAASMSAQGRSAASALAFDSDIHLSQPVQLHGMRAWREQVLGLGNDPAMTHVLCESARPVLGEVHTGSMSADVPALRGVGIRVGALFHGSDIRSPAAHARLYPDSPFHDTDDYTTRLEYAVQQRRGVLADVEAPVFVSTPDLLDFLPGATWLPLVIDVASFERAAALAGAGPGVGATIPLARKRPVVLHAPSNPRLKGTEPIEQALGALATRGLIEYRRLHAVPHAAMPSALAGADVVIDQVVLGNPGVLCVEAMAAGRVVVAHLRPEVRAHMARHDPEHAEPPVIEATAGTIGEVIEQICAQRSAYQHLAALGPQWARRNHDGRRSAAAMAPFLRS